MLRLTTRMIWIGTSILQAITNGIKGDTPDMVVWILSAVAWFIDAMEEVGSKKLNPWRR